MYKLLISGYYGFNNIGDESILLAVTHSLREKVPDIDITVLSHNPETTAGKFGVHAVDRKALFKIITAVWHCDMLISGGGSLLQDKTSRRSIVYYLFIMWIALLFGKKVFIYSQGMGPITSKLNRRLVGATLRRVHGIVVRDMTSKELLKEIGIPCERIEVTCDPVLGIDRVSLDAGHEILTEAGFVHDPERLTVGMAIRENRVNSPFVDELERAIVRLIAEKNAQVVLIPFHYSEDVAVIDELKRRLNGEVCCIHRKCLTEETLSLIGCMDVLVGVRLHSLIYAAIMGVPMVAIAYDPKINSFMGSVGLKAMSSVYDFRADYLLDEIERVHRDSDSIRQGVDSALTGLRAKLERNEEMINTIIRGGEASVSNAEKSE